MWKGLSHWIDTYIQYMLFFLILLSAIIVCFEINVMKLIVAFYIKIWEILYWCWEGLGARGKRDDRGWDGWMASLTRWTWVWVNSRSWWWTGRPGVLWFMGSRRVGYNWATELNWTEYLQMWLKASINKDWKYHQNWQNQIPIDALVHHILSWILQKIVFARGRVWGGRREEGSGWGTQVYLWRIHFDIWQNKYNIVKFKNKIKLKKILYARPVT